MHMLQLAWSKSLGNSKCGRRLRRRECFSKTLVRRRRRLPLVFSTRFIQFLLAIALLQPTVAVAQEPETAPGATAPVPALPLRELASPHATLHTFMRAMRDNEIPRAVACLDLGTLTKETAETIGPNVAYQLHFVIKQLTELSANVDWRWANISEQNDYPDPFSLVEIPGSLPDARELVIRRNNDDGNWRFSTETCATIDALYSKLEQAPAPAVQESDADEEIRLPFAIRLRNAFPVFLRNKTFMLPDYQWICLIALIFIGLAADAITRWLLNAISSRWLEDYVEDEEREARAKIWRPMGRLANAATWYWGTKLIGMTPTVTNILLIALKLFTIFAAAWTAFALTDVLAKFLAKQALRTSTKFDDLLVPLVSKSLKILAVCIAVLSAAQTFDLPVTGLVGGLGLGGAALAFAAKDAVANFFGSLTVLFDRPFEVGDWIVTDGAEGTIETVGFRSTRIRTFYNSLVTLPNSQLTTAVVDNMGRRRYRRLKTTLGVQYDTSPDQLEAFCEGIRELIRCHPNTRKDYFHVYFNDFGPSSLNIMLYCFFQCPDWSAELQSRHHLLSDIVRLAAELRVHFAFPTRTLHMVDADQEPAAHDFPEPAEKGKQIAEDIAMRPDDA